MDPTPFVFRLKLYIYLISTKCLISGDTRRDFKNACASVTFLPKHPTRKERKGLFGPRLWGDTVPSSFLKQEHGFRGSPDQGWFTKRPEWLCHAYESSLTVDLCYRLNRQCHARKILMKKTDEPGKFTSCESLCLRLPCSGSPWIDGSLPGPACGTGHPLTFHIPDIEVVV